MLEPSSRRQFLVRAGAAGFALATPGLFAACGGGSSSGASGGDIKIGLLLELTGPTSVYGEAVHNCALLAIEEINEAGGIMGRNVVPIVEDCQSDVSVTVTKARKLTQRDEVDLILGPISSDTNDAAAKIAEESGTLQFYPQLYEGGKCAANYFSFGSVPAQQVNPFIPFLQESFGPKVMLFGADFVWPRRSFEIAKPIIEENGGELVKELYLPIVTDDFTELIDAVKETSPDYIFAQYPAVFGASLKALSDQGLTEGLGIGNVFAGDLILPSVAEYGQGMLTSLDYFASIDTPANKKFLDAYQAMHGASALPSGAGEGPAAYNSLHLYKQAVEAAESTGSEEVEEALVGQKFE